MASVLQSDSRRLYSWWWDSHISPKNSKWLQDNLTDMDAKVKAMIKLIEEDADSFARRAEMYYKKRPELMKLVEEFYRAYRALSERYDHATGELRHAHRTMSQAFPDQVPFVISDDTPSNSEPNNPETPHPIRAFFDPENYQGLSGSNSDSGSTRMSREKGIGELSESSKENDKLKSQIVLESKRADKAETELQKLKEALVKLEAERNAISGKLFTLEKDLSHMQNDSLGLDILSSGANSEIQALKDALNKLEAERDASLLQYGECIEKIAALEKKLQIAEENLEMFTEQSKKAENEVKNLKEEISKVNTARDDVTFRYKQCLETISRLENDLREARAENGRLNSEVVLGSAKLKGAEDQCVMFGKMNVSLQLEAQKLWKKIAAADEELSRKQSELENLIVSLQDEHCRFVKAEATLHALQNLHSQSQEDQRALASELKNGLQMMKDLEICKRDLEAEIEQLKYENKSLTDLNSSSSVSQKNLQDELLKLKEIKGKLEAVVKHQTEKSDALQFQVKNLKEEIEGLYGRYQALMKQVESAGLDPESFGSSVKTLRDENSRLEEIMTKEKAEREALLEKLRGMDELFRKNTNLERSLLEVNVELAHSKEEANALKECFREINEQKSSIVGEKTALLSQLEIITETMQSLLQNNTALQTSLCSATAQLEGLRAKSKGLEEFCKLLSTERSNLQTERNTLVLRLEIVENKLDKLEMRFTNLEDKYDGLVMEKQSTVSQVDELKISLDFEKKERVCRVLSGEARLLGLEVRVQDLHVKNKHRKKEFEEQLEKAVNAQVEIFILQKFIQDMEDKNRSLLVECQRHVEASKYSEKLIMELEGENMVQELEADILLDKIEMLREGLVQVLKALEIKQGSESELERNFVPFVLSNIRSMKKSLSQSKDENQQLLIEKSVLSTLLGQLHFTCSELSSKKTALTQHLTTLDNEKHHLLEKSRQLNTEVDESERREVALKAEAEDLYKEQTDLRESYLTLEEENLKAFGKNKFLREELSRVMEEKDIDALAFSYQSVILKNFADENASEFENKANQLEEKLTENAGLRAAVEKLEEKQLDLSASNYNLTRQISEEKMSLNQKEVELSEARQKLKAIEATKADLEVARVVLQTRMAELYENNESHEKKSVHLQESNGNLESEVGRLHEKLEEYKIREVILTSQLHEMGSDFELWEAEATSFYFDLQISSVREALLENKVHELESEAQELKSHLTNCIPVIASRKDHIALREQNPVLDSKLLASGSTEPKESLGKTSSSSSPSPDAILELQKLQSRIKVIEDILNSEKETADIRLDSALTEIQDLKSRINSLNQDGYRQNSRESVSRTSEVKIRAEMKDIPLDRSDEQMLGQWEAADKENSNGEIESGYLDESCLNPTPESHSEKELRVDFLGSSRKGSKKTLMERLTSDTQKLLNLQFSVQEMRRKIEPKKRMRKTEDNNEYGSFRVRLKEVEKSVVSLMDINKELMKNLEEEESTSILETESEEVKAKDETAKIARLELEMQEIECTLMRLMDEQKTKGKGKSRSGAAILLRDFFYSRVRKNKRPNKSRFCGCMRSSAAKS